MNVGLPADLDRQVGGQCANKRILTQVHAVGQECGDGFDEILAPIQPAKPVQREEAGPSPVWFWIAAGVTVAAGAATGISALDTASKHDAFAANRSSQDASTAGQNAQTRTNVLAAVTGGAALATVAIGVFVVRW